jgi:putative DNA primase/helicase
MDFARGPFECGLIDRSFSTFAATDELAGWRQWVTWQVEDRGGQATKVPYDPTTGQRASVADPATWTDFPTAIGAFHEGGFSGVGFVLTPSDPYVGLDLDRCRDPLTGSIEPWAKQIVDLIGSYTEVSPSGRGLRLFIRASIPGERRRSGHIEMYADGRYLTVTGQHLAGTPTTIENRQAQLDDLYQQLFGVPEAMPRTGQRSLKPAPRLLPRPTGVVSTVSDEEVLRKALSAQNGDKFRDLWEGRWHLYAEYPSQSEADMALCRMLAYWTDGKVPQMDRLFRQSALMRPKWDELRGSQTYGQGTLSVALNSGGGAYGRF